MGCRRREGHRKEAPYRKEVACSKRLASEALLWVVVQCPLQVVSQDHLGLDLMQGQPLPATEEVVQPALSASSLGIAAADTRVTCEAAQLICVMQLQVLRKRLCRADRKVVPLADIAQ